jgi:hypothetical protein
LEFKNDEKANDDKKGLNGNDAVANDNDATGVNHPGPDGKMDVDKKNLDAYNNDPDVTYLQSLNSTMTRGAILRLQYDRHTDTPSCGNKRKCIEKYLQKSKSIHKAIRRFDRKHNTDIVKDETFSKLAKVNFKQFAQHESICIT